MFREHGILTCSSLHYFFNKYAAEQGTPVEPSHPRGSQSNQSFMKAKKELKCQARMKGERSATAVL